MERMWVLLEPRVKLIILMAVLARWEQQLWQCCNNPGAIIDGYVQRAIMYMQAHNEGKGGHGAMTVFLMELAIVFVNQSVLECCLSTLNEMLAHCKVIPCRRSLLPIFLPPSFFLIGRNNTCSQVMIYHLPFTIFVLCSFSSLWSVKEPGRHKKKQGRWGMELCLVAELALV